MNPKDFLGKYGHFHDSTIKSIIYDYGEYRNDDSLIIKMLYCCCLFLDNKTDKCLTHLNHNEVQVTIRNFVHYEGSFKPNYSNVSALTFEEQNPNELLLWIRDFPMGIDEELKISIVGNIDIELQCSCDTCKVADNI
jgi:hypothetical protein